MAALHCYCKLCPEIWSSLASSFLRCAEPLGTPIFKRLCFGTRQLKIFVHPMKHVLKHGALVVDGADGSFPSLTCAFMPLTGARGTCRSPRPFDPVADLEVKPLLDSLFRDALKAALRRNRMPFNISIVSFSLRLIASIHWCRIICFWEK